MIPLPDGGFIELTEQIEGMDGLEQVVRTLEARIEEMVGWDAPAVLLVLRGTPDGSLFLESPNWLPQEYLDDPAIGVLELVHLLRNGSDEDHDQLRDALSRVLGKTFYGVGMLYEAWRIERSSFEEAQNIVPSEAQDRVEVRGVTAVTRDGRVVQILRARGGFPEYMELDQTDLDHMAGGNVLDGLRLLCDELDKLAHGSR